MRYGFYQVKLVLVKICGIILVKIKAGFIHQVNRFHFVVLQISEIQISDLKFNKTIYILNIQYSQNRFQQNEECINQYRNEAKCSANNQCYLNGGLTCQSGTCQCQDNANKLEIVQSFALNYLYK